MRVDARAGAARRDARAGHHQRPAVAGTAHQALDPAFRVQAVDDDEVGLRQPLCIGRARLEDMRVGVAPTRECTSAASPATSRHVGQQRKLATTCSGFAVCARSGSVAAASVSKGGRRFATRCACRREAARQQAVVASGQEGDDVARPASSTMAGPEGSCGW